MSLLSVRSEMVTFALRTARSRLAHVAEELTDGRGAPVVHDSVGKDTHQASLGSLAPLRMLVNYGNASGLAPAASPRI